MRDEDVLDWEWITANRASKWPRLSCQKLADRAKSSPRDEVVGSGDRVMDAEEFAHRVAGVAARLKSEETDRPVVLLVDRSLTSAIGLMAVQWAGRLLIPLNPDDPEKRLGSILDRIGDCTLADVTGRGLSKLGSRTVKDLSEEERGWIDPVPVPGDMDSLVLFSSGSTGQPKGIVRAGWNLDAASILYRNRALGRKRFAVTNALYWAGGFDIFGTRMGDGFTYLVDPLASPAAHLAARLRDHEIDAIRLSPSLIESLARSLGDAPGVDTLLEVELVGEAPGWKTIEAARAFGNSRTSILSLYGASEVIGMIVGLRVGPEVTSYSGPLPMGDVAGDHVGLEPFGGEDSGLFEIVVHRWVSKGYWKDPETTDKVFGIDDCGDPVYRTSDLVRVEEGGLLRYVGRNDDVVKVSGKLVNPSEAAAVIAGLDGVRKAIVLPRTLESGRRQLIAHVEADTGVDPRDIQRRLSERLPRHLVPAVLVRHDVLPLLPGGKVDRQRLLSLPVVPWRVGVLREPRTKLEVFVLREVSLLLGVAGLGVDDDVWAFGLDSLGAIELTEVLTRHFSTSLGVNDFVGASTVAALARLLAGNRVDRVSHVVDFGPEGAGRSVFVFAGGGAPVLQIRHLAAELMGECRVFGVEQYGLQQRHRPDRSVRASARRNIAEITSVQPHGPYVLVGHSWGGLVAHEMACELRRAGYEVWLVLLDTANPTGGVSSDYVDGVAAAIDVPAQWRHGGRGRLRDWRWLVHRLGNHVRRFTTPANRYWVFFRVAARSARRHRPQVFGGPMLVVDADHSTASATWSAEPGVRSVQLSGDHRSILDPPHVNAVAQTITSFVKECQEATIQSGDSRGDRH